MEVFFQVNFLNAGNSTATIPIYAPDHPASTLVISFSFIKHSRRYYSQVTKHATKTTQFTACSRC